jgi:hypothetical protein
MPRSELLCARTANSRAAQSSYRLEETHRFLTDNLCLTEQCLKDIVGCLALRHSSVLAK